MQGVVRDLSQGRGDWSPGTPPGPRGPREGNRDKHGMLKTCVVRTTHPGGCVCGKGQAPAPQGDPSWR